MCCILIRACPDSYRDCYFFFQREKVKEPLKKVKRKRFFKQVISYPSDGAGLMVLHTC
jgi:hypothetical protein